VRVSERSLERETVRKQCSVVQKTSKKVLLYILRRVSVVTTYLTSSNLIPIYPIEIDWALAKSVQCYIAHIFHYFLRFSLFRIR